MCTVYGRKKLVLGKVVHRHFEKLKRACKDR